MSKNPATNASWLESLPLAAVLVDAGGHITASNSMAEPLVGALRKVALPEVFAADHALLQAIARASDAGRSVRLAEIAWPHALAMLPSCNAWISPQTSGVLILLDFFGANDAALSAGSHYTKLSSTMAAMLAHEIRNPLLAIRGAAQLLEGTANAEDAPLCTLIASEVARIDQLVATLDPLAPSAPRAMAALNIHEVLEHARLATIAALRSKISFALQYDPSLPDVPGVRSELVQVLLNLMKNAAEAVADSAEPCITLTTRYVLGETRRNAGGEKLPIAVSIADNGPGIAPDIAPRLFAPFTTTKPDGRGLGLAIVARIVQEHGGLIAPDSPNGGGARFTLYLPAVS
jgi:two-component system nitrogen regulation sensor histidine kinase GlnL